MSLSRQSPSCYEIKEKNGNELSVRFNGRMDSQTAALFIRELLPLIRAKNPSTLTADLANVTHFDDFGALVLFEIKSLLNGSGDGAGHFTIINASDNISAYLSKINFESLEKCVPAKRKRSFNMVVRLGEATITEASSLRYMLIFLGSVMLSFVYVLFHPRSLRTDDTITHMEPTGVDALPIVALISFLLGLIMAFMSSIQFRQFGASIYVASLVAFAMVSELGPIMTAIVVAGRSGSAYAAEIGTMKISEEVDALVTMGFNPVIFLAIPRLMAAMVVVPLLTLFSDLFAIAGGLVVGVFMLQLTPNTYIKQTIEILTITEIVWAMVKSGVFAVLIAWVGCLRGFQAQGGASAVGNAATSAVVTSIFLIILSDSIFAVIRSYWG